MSIASARRASSMAISGVNERNALTATSKAPIWLIRSFTYSKGESDLCRIRTAASGEGRSLACTQPGRSKPGDQLLGSERLQVLNGQCLFITLQNQGSDPLVSLCGQATEYSPVLRQKEAV